MAPGLKFQLNSILINLTINGHIWLLAKALHREALCYTNISTCISSRLRLFIPLPWLFLAHDVFCNASPAPFDSDRQLLIPIYYAGWEREGGPWQEEKGQASVCSSWAQIAIRQQLPPVTAPCWASHRQGGATVKSKSSAAGSPSLCNCDFEKNLCILLSLNFLIYRVELTMPTVVLRIKWSEACFVLGSY